MPFFNSLSGGQRKLLLPGKTFVLLQSRKEKKSTSLKCISWSYINDIPIVARTNAILLAFSSISTYLQEFQSFLNIQFHIYNQNSILKSPWCCVVVVKWSSFFLWWRCCQLAFQMNAWRPSKKPAKKSSSNTMNLVRKYLRCGITPFISTEYTQGPIFVQKFNFEPNFTFILIWIFFAKTGRYSLMFYF